MRLGDGFFPVRLPNLCSSSSAPPYHAGEPIAYVAETEAELEEAKAKAAGGAASNGAVAAPAAVEVPAPPQVSNFCVRVQAGMLGYAFSVRLERQI